MMGERSYLCLRPGSCHCLFQAGVAGATLAMVIGMSLMGLAYGPLGTVSLRTFSDSRALYQQFADIQPGGHFLALR